MSLLDDLISSWELDESSGTRYDSHGSNDLTDHNSVGSASAFGGTVADFESSSSQYLSLASNSSVQFADEPITILAWAKLESTGSPMMLVAKDSDAAREYFLAYGNNGPGFSWCVFDYAQDAREVTQSESSPSSGVWYMVAVRHDPVADLISISLNAGTANTLSHSAGLYPGSAEFRIGARAYPGFQNYFDGLAGPVRLYRRVLSDSEVTEHYNGGTPLTYAALGGSSPTTVSPSSIASGSAVGSPTLAPGPVSASPGPIVATSAFGSPTLAPGTVIVSPSGMAGGNTLGSPALSPGVAAISPTSIASSSTLGGPALSAGTATAFPASIAPASALGSPVLSPGAASASPTGIASTLAVGSATLLGPGSVQVQGIDPTASVGAPTLSGGTATLSPASIASGSTAGNPTLAPGVVVVSPAGIAPSGTLGTPALGQGLATIHPSGIGSSASLGLPTLVPGLMTIFPSGFTRPSMIGSPVLSTGGSPELPDRNPDSALAVSRIRGYDPEKPRSKVH